MNGGGMSTLLEVQDLRVNYGKVEAVHNISLKVGAGQIVTVIGPNGAGKTTSLAAIMGLMNSSGQIVFDGHAQRRANVEKRVIQGLALVPEKRDLFGEMSVEDNLLLGAFQRYRQGHRDQAKTMDEVFELFPRLKERRDQAAATMSGGERQMLAIGRALMTNPRLLMLDEATEGLAPLIREEIWTCLRQLKNEHQAILVVDKNVDALTSFADRHVVIEKGAVVWTGTSHALRSDPSVKDRFLHV